MNNINLNLITDLVIMYGSKIIFAVAVLVLGIFMTKLVIKVVGKVLVKSNFDITLSKFILSLLNIVIRVFVFISVISMLGVETASFIAIIGTAGLAIGLALQGSFSNFSAGFLIILFRPIKIDDYITVKDYSGFVSEIQIFHTIIVNEENVKIIIPNGMIIAANIVVHKDKVIGG